MHGKRGGGVHGKRGGCAWQRACVVGGMHGRGCAWQGVCVAKGVCIAGGMHDRRDSHCSGRYA